MAEQPRLGRRTFLAAAGAAALGAAVGCAPSRSPSTRTDALVDLAKRVSGPVVRPGSPEFESLSIPRNLRFAATMPRAVVLCEDAEDVAASVRWAVQTQTPFAVRGGGHNYYLGSSSDGIIISTRRMVRAEVQGTTLRTQSGLLNSGLGDLLAGGGAGTLLLPGGNCPGVGIAGATLGGGIGPNAPWAGLSADRLREVSMVTAGGDVVTASASANADLFWGLRGGAGGNFGIVTDLRYDLLEIPVERATTVRLTFPGGDGAVEVALAWQRIRASAPRIVSGTWSTNLSSESGLRCVVRCQVLGDEASARDLLAPLLALPVVEVELNERPWWDAYAWYRTLPTPPNYFWDRSLYLDRDLDADVLARAVAVVGQFPTGIGEKSGGNLGLFGWVGGAVSDVPPDATAYVHRRAVALLELNAGWQPRASDAAPHSAASSGEPAPIPSAVREWMDRLWEVVLPSTTGRSYQNFPDPELPDPAASYYGANLPRLERVRADWDPDGVFNYPQSIPGPP